MSRSLQFIGLLVSAGLLLSATVVEVSGSAASAAGTLLKDTPARLVPSRTSVDRGERLALMLCAHCHGDDEGRLVGRELTDVDRALGRIYSGNLTNDPAHGLGRWTNAQLTTFLRTGVTPAGKLAFFVMPRYPRLADEDLAALVAYLRSDRAAVQGTGQATPRSQLSLLSKALMKVAIKPLPLPAQPISLPDTLQPVRHGEYLVNGQLQCFACHSANVQKTNLLEPLKTKGYLAGGSRFNDEEGRPVRSANLTPDPGTGIGRYSLSQFQTVMRTGQKPDGTLVRYPMLPNPLLTDTELKALYTYLRTVTPRRHAVRP